MRFLRENSVTITALLEGRPIPEPDRSMPAGDFGLVDATEAVGDGFKVIPLAPLSRSPLKGSHAHYDATDDLDQVQAWWREDPARNVGAATTGLVVIDLDLDEPECVGSLRALVVVQRCDLPETMTVRTPSGGLHLWYRTTAANRHLKQMSTSRLPVRGEMMPAPKIDMIHGGPYVPIPGTRRRHGVYEYLNPQLPVEAPSWIIGPRPKPLSAIKYEPAASTGKRVRSLLETVQNATSGERNAVLNWAAYRMAEIVAEGVVSSATAEAALLEAATGAGLGQREARLTIRSGLNGGDR